MPTVMDVRSRTIQGPAREGTVLPMTNIPDYQIILAMAPRPEGHGRPVRAVPHLPTKPVHAGEGLRTRIRALVTRTTLGPSAAGRRADRPDSAAA